VLASCLLKRGSSSRASTSQAAYPARMGRAWGHRRKGTDDPHLQCRAYRSAVAAKPTRIGYKTLEMDQVRFARRSGEVIDR